MIKIQGKEMYYQRIISDDLKNLLLPKGELYWLYELVKERADLDFLLGANKSKNWISVYRGTTKLLEIKTVRQKVNISAALKYIELANNNQLKIYGKGKEKIDLNFKDDFITLISCLSQDSKLNKHYSNKKEGYYQNIFSRQFGIQGTEKLDFAVIDKEVVLGYKNKEIKGKYFGKERAGFMAINKVLSQKDPKRYGSKLTAKSLGNELDFMAVSKNNEILLIEFKHGSSTKGVYLSPIQIGLYFNLFQQYRNQYNDDFIADINKMIQQKKEMNLISQNCPDVTSESKLVPILVIAAYKPKSSAMEKFKDVLKICKSELKDSNFLSDLKIYTYDENKVLNQLHF